MSATRDGKMWRCQFYYKDWQGVSHKKNKRGFKTKAEAEQWERDFLQQQQRNLDINFENFVQIYYEDMEHRLRENTMRTKKFIIDLKIIPYFKIKNMNEIKASDIRAWQNSLMKKGYSETYLKTVNNQLSAIFNYAVRYYDLKDNPCRKAGSIGKSHAGEKEFWTKQEFKQFLVTVENKPETKMAFLLLYWTGMRIGELLDITYNDIDLEKRTISVKTRYHSFYLKCFDHIRQYDMRRQVRPQVSRKNQRYPYEDSLLFLPYHPVQELVQRLDACPERPEWVWDFSRKAPGKMKRQIFDILNHFLEEDRDGKLLRDHLKRLWRFYQFCIKAQIEDIEQMGLEQTMDYQKYLRLSLVHHFPKSCDSPGVQP